jgi:hypothetical protein
MVDDIPAALAQLPLKADATAADRPDRATEASAGIAADLPWRTAGGAAAGPAYRATEASAGVETHAPPWATDAAAALGGPQRVSLGWTAAS